MTARDVGKSAAWLAGQLSGLQDDVTELKLRKPSLAMSSIEDGAIDEYTQDGTLASVTGKQVDGSHVSMPFTGPKPAAPVAATLKALPGTVEVRWNGKFSGDQVSSLDFKHVSVHTGPTPDVDTTPNTQVATIRGELGDVATIIADEGMVYVVLVAWTEAGKSSDPSPVAAVAVPAAVDSSMITDLQASIDGKTTIHNSTLEPALGDYTEGDRWQKWSTLTTGGNLLASWRWTDGAWVAESMDPTYLPLIDIGAGTFGKLTGSQLESTLILTTDIVAGNPMGTNSTMGPNGFSVMASTDGLAPTAVIRMGSDTNDYFGVANAGGELVASITSLGDGSFNSLDAATDISISGTPLADTLDLLPRGLVAWAVRGTDAKYWAGATLQPYLHVAFDTPPGRMFRVSTTPVTVNSDTVCDAVVALHVTGVETGEAQALISSPVVSRGITAASTSNTRRSPVTFNRIVDGGNATSVAVLLSYGTLDTGRAKIAGGGYGQAVYLTVEDIGPRIAQIGESIDGTSDAATSGNGGGSSTPPPVVKNYDRTWNATGTRSFVGSGGTYAYNTGYMYSGQSPAGYGDLSSMAVFPNLTGELSGATITGMWVYVYYDFWYQGSGGNAYIGLHGWASLPSTKPAKTYAHAVSNNWPRAAGRWIPMSSSTFAGWKSGQHRGITLGGSGGGYERYGYAHNPKIRIKYTK